MPRVAPRRPSRSTSYLAALTLAVLAACDRRAAEAAGQRAAESAPAAPSRAAAAAVTRADVEQELARQLPNLALTFHAADTSGAAAAYRTLWFEYQTPGKRWPYGAGFALWRDGDRVPRWYRLQHGDFGPHSLFWVDANRDGRLDIFFQAGEEDVYSTYLFVDRGERSAFTDSAFARAYLNENDYSTLVDLDADGTPEIIDSGHPGDEHVDAPGCDGLELPPGIREEVAREYRRIVGAFDDANFKYGVRDHAFFTLHLLDPVRVLAIRDARAVDVTREFAEHLQWRVELLSRLRATSGRPCRGTIDTVSTYLRRTLAAAPGA